MKLTAYFCSGELCSVIRGNGHIRGVCLAYGVEFHDVDAAQISPEHRELAERAGLPGFPLFVAEDGPDVRVFDASGWSSFERKLRGNGVGA